MRHRGGDHRGPPLPWWWAGLHLRPLVLLADPVNRQTRVIPYSWFLIRACPPSPTLGRVTSLSVTTGEMVDNLFPQRGQAILDLNQSLLLLFSLQVT